MHRHSYIGTKLSRPRGQRLALLRGLATSVILQESVTTTLAKAKAVVPMLEKTITKAKKGDLHSMRQVRSVLYTDAAARKLQQELAPLWKDRPSGHVRVIKAGWRLGDSAPLAVISLILPEKPQVLKPEVATEPKQAPKKPVAKKAPAKKPAVKKAAPKKKESNENA